MIMHAALIDRSSTLASFHDWQSEQDSLESQLSESLNALAAYQSQLDTWQLQLAGERVELQKAREQVEQDQAETENSRKSPSPELVAELRAARETIATLETRLVTSAEEARCSDSQRTEIETELALALARGDELNGALEEQRNLLDDERRRWTDEMQVLREMLATRNEASQSFAHRVRQGKSPVEDQVVTQLGTSELVKNNPVLGSIVEQFGKLRQQRANERQSFQKTR